MALIEIREGSFINSRCIARVDRTRNRLSIMLTTKDWTYVEGEDVPRVHQAILENMGYVKLDEMEEPDA